MPFVALPSVWKNLFQAGPGSHIRASCGCPTSVSIWPMASKIGRFAMPELCSVMSTPFG